MLKNLIERLFPKEENLSAEKDDRSSIPIKFTIEDSEMPEGWKVAPVNANFTKLKQKEKETSVQIIAKAFNKYPLELIQFYVETVFVFRRMQLYGYGYAGTHQRKSLMLSNDGVSNGYSIHHLEETVHHELASLFLFHNKEKLNGAKWLQLNERTYPTDDAAGAFRVNLTDNQFRKHYADQGFLHAFASSGLRNDFVSHAENIWMGNDLYYKWLEKYPKLYAKYKITCTFFYLLDDRLTPQYFNKLRQ